MIVNLVINEVNLVAGGKRGLCHFVSATKKGLEIGGTVLCLSFERANALRLDVLIPDRDTRGSVLKAVCGFGVGAILEGFTHVMEAVSGADC